MNKYKKSADSADKVQTHLSALFNKGIAPYNIDFIIYIYIYIYKYNKIRQYRQFSMHRGRKEQSRHKFTRMKKTCLHYEKPSQAQCFQRFRVQTFCLHFVCTFSFFNIPELRRNLCRT
jgi:rhamnogalacturonyl hydrolase YesR